MDGGYSVKRPLPHLTSTNATPLIIFCSIQQLVLKFQADTNTTIRRLIANFSILDMRTLKS